MNTPPYLLKMACGDQSIVLESGVSYESFPKCAARWAERLRLTITKRIDGPSEHIWECHRDGCWFWLAFDDWFPEISLEPKDHDAGQLILTIASEVGLERSKD